MKFVKYPFYLDMDNYMVRGRRNRSSWHRYRAMDHNLSPRNEVVNDSTLVDVLVEAEDLGIVIPRNDEANGVDDVVDEFSCSALVRDVLVGASIDTCTIELARDVPRVAEPQPMLEVIDGSIGEADDVVKDVTAIIVGS